jgi:hypothetical protein
LENGLLAFRLKSIGIGHDEKRWDVVALNRNYVSPRKAEILALSWCDWLFQRVQENRIEIPGALRRDISWMAKWPSGEEKPGREVEGADRSRKIVKL